MVHSTNKASRSLVVLALPRRVSALIAYATGVVEGMTGNPTFPCAAPGITSAEILGIHLAPSTRLLS
jgi:hypothetical protein